MIRKYFLSLSIILGFGMVSFAQTEPETSPTPSETKQEPQSGETLRENLKLTADQEVQLKTILKDTRSERQALKDNATLSKEDLKAKLEQLKITRDDKIQAVLKPEQFAKWNEWKVKIKGANKERLRVPKAHASKRH